MFRAHKRQARTRVFPKRDEGGSEVVGIARLWLARRRRYIVVLNLGFYLFVLFY